MNKENNPDLRILVTTNQFSKGILFNTLQTYTVQTEYITLCKNLPNTARTCPWNSIGFLDDGSVPCSEQLLPSLTSGSSTIILETLWTSIAHEPQSTTTYLFCFDMFQAFKMKRRKCGNNRVKHVNTVSEPVSKCAWITRITKASLQNSNLADLLILLSVGEFELFKAEHRTFGLAENRRCEILAISSSLHNWPSVYSFFLLFFWGIKLPWKYSAA